MKIFMCVLVLLILSFAALTWWVSRPVFDETRGTFEPGIADPETALTFARAKEGLIWVTAHSSDSVSGVNLSKMFGESVTADLTKFIREFDEAALPDPRSNVESFPLAQLLPPLAYTDPHVAVGTNFKEHAEEVYSDDPPFLFPKLAQAGGWRDPVPFTVRLDYEAEVCLFPLADIHSSNELPRFGIVLCNDFTDRWMLIKELKIRQPLGLTGFASGKGRPGYLPTGYLVVIPRSPDFYLSLEVSLYVNDSLRQQFAMRDVILKIEDIVSQAFEKRELRYQKGEETVSLMPLGYIPSGTLILTGTAAGVIFKPLNIWNQSLYLKSGDVVRTEASWLGHLENTIVDERG